MGERMGERERERGSAPPQPEPEGTNERIGNSNMQNILERQGQRCDNEVACLLYASDLPNALVWIQVDHALHSLPRRRSEEDDVARHCLGEGRIRLREDDAAAGQVLRRVDHLQWRQVEERPCTDHPVGGHSPHAVYLVCNTDKRRYGASMQHGPIEHHAPRLTQACTYTADALRALTATRHTRCGCVLYITTAPLPSHGLLPLSFPRRPAQPPKK